MEANTTQKGQEEERREKIFQFSLYSPSTLSPSAASFLSNELEFSWKLSLGEKICRDQHPAREEYVINREIETENHSLVTAKNFYLILSIFTLLKEEFFSKKLFSFTYQ